jgi:cation/acetate symporter
MVTGTASTLILILLSPTVWKDLLGNPEAILSLKNPGVITVPLSFLVGIIVSLSRREPEAETGFAAAQHRMHFGPD